MAVGDFNGDSDPDLAVASPLLDGRVSILLAAAPPEVSIDDVSQAEGDSGDTTYTFTVTRSGNLSGSSRVHYATANGSATTADGDYASTSGDLAFAIGEASKTVEVTVNGDTAFEPTEDFFVNLSSATNATIFDSQGKGTIQNDDPQPTVSISDVSAERATPAPRRSTSRSRCRTRAPRRSRCRGRRPTARP